MVKLKLYWIILLLNTTLSCWARLSSDGLSKKWEGSGVHYGAQESYSGRGTNCFCVDDGKTVPDLLLENGQDVTRLIIFVYKQAASDTLKIYIPDTKYQEIIPDLPIESNNLINVDYNTSIKEIFNSTPHLDNYYVTRQVNEKQPNKNLNIILKPSTKQPKSIPEEQPSKDLKINEIVKKTNNREKIYLNGLEYPHLDEYPNDNKGKPSNTPKNTIKIKTNVKINEMDKEGNNRDKILKYLNGLDYPPPLIDGPYQTLEYLDKPKKTLAIETNPNIIYIPEHTKHKNKKIHISKPNKDNKKIKKSKLRNHETINIDGYDTILVDSPYQYYDSHKSPKKYTDFTEFYQIPEYLNYQVEIPSYKDVSPVTFETWFNNQVIQFKDKNPVIVNSISLKLLKDSIEKKLANNGIFIKENGILFDSKGVKVSTENLKLQPVLIGYPITYKDILKNSVNDQYEFNVPFLFIVFLTEVNPPRIIGSVPLGKTFIPNEKVQFKLNCDHNKTKPKNLSWNREVVYEFLSTRRDKHDKLKNENNARNDVDYISADQLPNDFEAYLPTKKSGFDPYYTKELPEIVHKNFESSELLDAFPAITYNDLLSKNAQSSLDLLEKRTHADTSDDDNDSSNDVVYPKQLSKISSEIDGPYRRYNSPDNFDLESFINNHPYLGSRGPIFSGTLNRFRFTAKPDNDAPRRSQVDTDTLHATKRKSLDDHSKLAEKIVDLLQYLPNVSADLDHLVTNVTNNIPTDDKLKSELIAKIDELLKSLPEKSDELHGLILNIYKNNADDDTLDFELAEKIVELLPSLEKPSLLRSDGFKNSSPSKKIASRRFESITNYGPGDESGGLIRVKPIEAVTNSTESRKPDGIKKPMPTVYDLLDLVPDSATEVYHDGNKTDISPEFRIIGGSAATGSGTPISSRGRSGEPQGQKNSTLPISNSTTPIPN